MLVTTIGGVGLRCHIKFVGFWRSVSEQDDLKVKPHCHFCWQIGIATVTQNGNKSTSTPRATEPNVMIYRLLGSTLHFEPHQVQWKNNELRICLEVPVHFNGKAHTYFTMSVTSFRICKGQNSLCAML